MLEKEKWYLTVPGVLALLFFVLGPLALPLLYKSPKFSPIAKILLTFFVLGLTLVVTNMLVNSLKTLYTQMQQLGLLLK